jgi:hypothetical protein
MTPSASTSKSSSRHAAIVGWIEIAQLCANNLRESIARLRTQQRSSLANGVYWLSVRRSGVVMSSNIHTM